MPAERTVTFLNEEKDEETTEEKNKTSTNHATPSTLLACILLLPKDSESALAIVHKLVGSSDNPAAANTTIVRKTSSRTPPEDEWLNHIEAAAYLGIAKSTLYRYSEQLRIESRKLGGHLEYRRTALDKFKDQHVRPARRTTRRECIIPSALSSGK